MEDFIRRAADGEWGAANRSTLLDFLDQVERIILGNIEDHAEETPGQGLDPEEAREQASESVARARAIVLESFPSP